MAGRDWLDAVLDLGPEWKGHEGGADAEAEGGSGGAAPDRGDPLRCPHCGELCPGYDTRRREWRILDAWGYKTFRVCNVPRPRDPREDNPRDLLLAVEIVTVRLVAR